MRYHISKLTNIQIWNVEDSQRYVELVTILEHLDLGGEAVDLCISDVGSVNVGKQPNTKQPREDVEIKLPRQALVGIQVYGLDFFVDGAVCGCCGGVFEVFDAEVALFCSWDTNCWCWREAGHDCFLSLTGEQLGEESSQEDSEDDRSARGGR